MNGNDLNNEILITKLLTQNIYLKSFMRARMTQKYVWVILGKVIKKDKGRIVHVTNTLGSEE